MQFRVRKAAHVLGTSLGLRWLERHADCLLAAHVGSSIAALTSQDFSCHDDWWRNRVYLGIDTPSLASHGPKGELSKGGSSGKINTAEFVSAVGAFLATSAAFASVGVIVLREPAHLLDNNSNVGMGSWA